MPSTHKFSRADFKLTVLIYKDQNKEYQYINTI